MKILQICSARDIGGGERHVADLANGLAARGHEVFAVVNPNARITAELRGLSGQNVFEVRMRGSVDAAAAGRIAKIARDTKIDVIHAHIARDYPIAAITSRRSGTPFVLTRHVIFPLSKLHRLLLRRASRVIAVSNAVAESLKRRNIFDPKKIVTIHNGIRVEHFQKGRRSSPLPSALRDIGAKHVVGTIGHIAPIKGQVDLVRAAHVIVRERDDVDVVIVGEDKSRDQKNQKELEQLISDLGVGTRVHLIGWQDDVSELLPHLDIFVSAARSEPFGLVILEAMAAGVPVVATESEGATEILDDGRTGLIVPVGRPDDLADAVMSLLNDGKLRQTLAKNALAVVRGSFSLDDMIDATVRVYRDVVSS